MNILNKEISFPLAKLLKEKNIIIKSTYWYNLNEYLLQKMFTSDEVVTVGDLINHEVSVEHYEAPTIADVIDWIYQEYCIWISVHPLEIFVKDIKFTISIYDKDGYIGMGSYNAPSEAYEEAIKYVLEKY